MSNYDALNMAEVAEEIDRLENQGNTNTDFLSNFVRMPEKEGYVIIRLLPPAKGKKFYCATRTHRLNKNNVHCPRELNSINGVKRWLDVDQKNPCPICKYYNQLYRDADETTGEESNRLVESARKIKPIERYYYNCTVRHQVNDKGEVEENIGPKILSIGKTLHEKILRNILGDAKLKKKGLGDVSDVKLGRDFQIVKKIKKGKDGSYPQYDDSEFLDPAVLGDPAQVELWLNGLHDLGSLRKLKPVSEMKIALKKYLGLIPDEETNFDINEFRPSSVTASIADQVQQERERVEVATASPNESLTETDFLKELRKVQ
jgi:hypothetical protein